MSDFETLASGAVAYRPWRKSTDNDNDYVVYASGTPATDEANVAAAVTALNSAGEGTLRLESGVTLTAAHEFTSPINLRGLGSNTVVNTTYNYGFTWNCGSAPGAPGSGYAITATAGDEYFETTAFTPAAGDVVVLHSYDAIPGVYPHQGVGSQYPGELHRVVRWESGTNRAYIDGVIIDTMSTSAKAAVLTNVLEDVVVADLTMAYTGSSQGDYAFGLRFWGCLNATVENVHFTQEGPGSISFGYCKDCHVRGITLENVANDDATSCLQTSFSNGIYACDFVLGGGRHNFTTASSMSSGNDRWGTPMNVRLSNGQFRGFSELDGSSRVAFKTHSEGYGITVDGCSFDMGTDEGCWAVAALSRNTQILNCHIQGQLTGTSGTYGVRVGGPDAVVKNCVFDSNYIPLSTTYWIASTDTYASGTVFQGNIIRNAFGAGIQCRGDSTGIIIKDNVFVNVGNYASGTAYFEKACIDIQGGSGHRISHNDMTKANNDYSVDIDTMAATDVEMAGNVCYGYGSGVVGFQGTNAAAAETAWAADNYTDA